MAHMETAVFIFEIVGSAKQSVRDEKINALCLSLDLHRQKDVNIDYIVSFRPFKVKPNGLEVFLQPCLW